MTAPLVLASKSAARAALMRGAGLDFTTASAGVDEDVIKRGLLGRGASPREIAHVLAEEKAKACSLRQPGPEHFPVHPNREIREILSPERVLSGEPGATSPGRALVVGADQTLDLEGRLMDKPASLEEARQHLLDMRGREHRLHSGLAVAEAGEIVFTTVETAVLKVRAFSDTWLDRYLDRNGDQILASVGAYQLEGEGVQLFERIEGDYFVILGLPLLSLLSFLRDRGALPE
jgi:septum formation protein